MSGMSRGTDGHRMGTIVVSDNVSLDGVIQDPAGDEGFARGGWVGLIKDRPELARLALDEALARRGHADGSADLRVVRRRDGHPGPASWRTG